MNLLQKAAVIFLGSLLVGVGVNFFLVPHQLMDGGMIGIGLLAKYYLSWPPGLLTMICSLPIYGIVFYYDRFLFYRSFHGMILSSFFIDAFSPIREWYFVPIETAAVSGGAFIGAGIGLMLAYKTNTGGTDLLAQFLAYRLKLSVALLIFIIDGFIIALSLEVIGLEKTIFSLLTIITVALTTQYFSQIRN